MSDGVSRLTERERDVLRLLARGHDVKSIARELSVSTSAVNERLREARRKLGVSSSREAARILAGASSPQATSSHNLSVDRNFDLAAGPNSAEASDPFNWNWKGATVAILLGSALVFGMLIGRQAPATADPAAPPRVVSTNPRPNSVIRPGTILLSVTFDRPMAEGNYSFVQKSAETYPQCDRRATLSRDGRTFTIRCVTLPGRRYEVWFNNPPYMNFRGLNGLPAQPFQLLFSTRGR